jgi:hypothetical protein
VLHGLRQASLSPGLSVAAATSTTPGSGASCGAAKAHGLYISAGGQHLEEMTWLCLAVKGAQKSHVI